MIKTIEALLHCNVVIYDIRDKNTLFSSTIQPLNHSTTQPLNH